jgi:hypothetical protein
VIELLAIFAVLAAVWGVLGSRSGADDEAAPAPITPVIERGSAARRMLG